jgi:hypothetical protein
VTTKVLHDTACPVWTGEHAEDALEFATVLCAADRPASRLAHDNQAKLFLVHAIPGAEVAPEK